MSGLVLNFDPLPFFSIFDARTDYGAKGDSVTDDTAAIQAALDDAAVSRGLVYLPTTGGQYMFSNLLMGAFSGLAGPLMGSAYLTRIAGSTGPAIRERNNITEGNPAGADGLWIKNLFINGAGTPGDGIYVGYQVAGHQLNFCSGLQNVHVRNFPTGTGIKIYQNAARCGYLWSNVNQVGIETAGGGNVYATLFAEANSVRDMLLGGIWDTFSGIGTSTNTGAESIKITGGGAAIYGCHISMSANMGNLILIDNGVSATSIHDLGIDAHGFTFTNGIFSDSFNVGSGVQLRVPEWIDDNGLYPSYRYDSTNNKLRKISSGRWTSLPASGLTYLASMTPDLNVAAWNNIVVSNTSAMTINAPVNGASGDELSLNFLNSSGGVMGVVTWNGAFKLAGAFTNPASTKYRSITFVFNGAFWIEKSRAMADIG